MVRSSLHSRTSFALETVSTSGICLMQRAKNAGYPIRLHFVGTDDAAINLARVSRLGHDIPTETIVRRYHEDMPYFRAALALCDLS